MLAKQEGGSLGNLVARSYALSGRGINHALVALAVGIELIISQRGDDDARRNSIDTGTTLTPCGSCGTLGLQVVQSLGNHVGEARVLHGYVFDKRHVLQFLSWCANQLHLHVVGNRVHIGSLTRDDKSGTACCHYFAEGIHGITRAHHVEIYDMFRVGLIGRCTGCVDEVHHGAQFGSFSGECFHAVLLQGVHHKCFHIVATAAEVLADALQCLLADVAQENLLASTDAAHDGGSHTTGTQECHYLFLVVSVEYHHDYLRFDYLRFILRFDYILRCLPLLFMNSMPLF